MPIGTKCIFITSAGRTGTRFMGQTFTKLMPNSISYHEPSVLNWRHRREWLWKIMTFGLLNMTFRKIIGCHSMKRCSHKRLLNLLPDEEIIRSLHIQRDRFIMAHLNKIYIESNWMFCGIFDLLDRAFPNSRIIYLVRDPRTWTISNINWGRWYQKGDWISLLYLGRLRADMFRNDRYRDQWSSFSPFEKLCWSWQKLTSFALERITTSQSVKIYKYEDVFLSPYKYECFAELVEFATKFPDGTSVDFEIPENVLDKVIHKSMRKMPPWKEWSHHTAKRLHKICGKTMREFGYGEEPEWKEKLLS